MKVSEIMKTFFLTVSQEMPLREANELMHRFNSDYIIVSEGKKLHGILTASDLFRQLLPAYKDVMRDESYNFKPELIGKRIADISKKKVKDIMVTDIIKVHQEMFVVEAGSLMISKNVKQLPVIDGNNDLVGVISFRDITWGLLMKQNISDKS